MKRWMIAIAVFLSWQAILPVASAAVPDLVLVASIRSTVPALSANEVSHLYMGVPIFHDGKIIKPLLNYSDSYTQETFMQKIMLMSTQAYERQILSKIFRMGGNRPPVHAGLTRLISALQADPTTISYMYSDEAAAHPDLRIISVLWSESNNDN